jgi:hypothetical protein
VVYPVALGFEFDAASGGRIFSIIQEKTNGSDINNPASTRNQELHFTFMPGQQFIFPVEGGLCGG